MDKKTLLELLEQHKDIKKEINKLEKRLERFNKLSPTTSDVVQNGYKRHLVIRGVDYNRSDKIYYLESLLKERYNNLLECQTKVEEELNKLPSDIRQILEHRYIDSMSWIQIQFEMGYEHEDRARKKHDRFFENF